MVELLKTALMADLLPLIVAFAVTAALGPVFIPWLHKLKFGQEIREEGPKWHQKKSGTPTMGGIMFIIGIGIAVIAVCVIAALKGSFSAALHGKLLLLYIIALGFGMVGFVDDYIKVVKKRNLGLKPMQKLVLQLVMTIVYVIAAYIIEGGLSTEILIPFTSFTITLPLWLYVPFIMFVMLGTVNAVNLTDGLDGLASTVTFVEALYFAFLGVAAAGCLHISYIAVAVAGGMLGFLIYNRHPAKVFMGDTGSLFLGGAVAIMAIDTHTEIFVIIAGFVYFMETLSVIMQTTYFKYTRKKYGEGRRIFKMTPIHHHFEMCKWSEKKIVTVFSAVTLILCVIAVLSNFHLSLF